MKGAAASSRRTGPPQNWHVVSAGAEMDCRTSYVLAQRAHS
jgi:hypothetical protein